MAWYVRRRGIRMVRAGDARILFSLNRHGTLTITARRGGTVMTMRVLDAHRVELGPGRAATRGVVRAAARVVGRAAQADAVVFDGTSLAAHAADEHRRIAHEGGIRRRRHYKVFLAVALGPGDRIAIIAIAAAGENAGDAPSFRPLAEAAVECGALGPGTHVLADKAYATRETVAWCADHGARAVIPVRINSSGKSMGSMEWRRHVVENLVPPEMRRRFMRGGDVQSLPLEVRVRAQRGWMEENGYGRRAAVEYVIGAFKRIFDGAVASRRLDLVALEMARKAAIYNAACP
ncbi:MAG: IS4/IS5 family transposase [Thaumarchaeota archaeon S13]|nr:MAG: IS4/IS5 family transposase [Thaumarchaeota archaeon S13]